MLRYEVVADVNGLVALRDKWDELHFSAKSSRFAQSFAWCWNSWVYIARFRARRLFCLIAWDNDKLVMIWPFVIEYRAGFRIARPLGPQTTDYSEILIADSADVNALVDAWTFLSNISDCDIFIFPYVRSTGPLATLLASIAGQRRSRVTVTGRSVVKSIDWTSWNDWTSYYSGLDRKQRRDIARRRRRLEEKGTVLFEAEAASPDRAEAIDWIFHFKTRWQHRKNYDTNMVTRPEYNHLLKALAPQSTSQAGLIVSTLKLNGTTIAAALSRVDKVGLEAMMTTFDPAWHMFAPSHCLYEALLKWAFERGLNVDLRLGNEGFKDYWNVTTDVTVNYIVANSLRGRLFPVALSARDAFRRYRFTVNTS